MERASKPSGITEGQLLFDFIVENPEYVLKRVDRAIDHIVEERIEVLREEFEQRIDQAIKEVILRIASDQFAELVDMPNKYAASGSKSLKLSVRDWMIKKTSQEVRNVYYDVHAVKSKLFEIERRLDSEDGDWWKYDGEYPDGAG